MTEKFKTNDEAYTIDGRKVVVLDIGANSNHYIVSTVYEDEDYAEYWEESDSFIAKHLFSAPPSPALSPKLEQLNKQIAAKQAELNNLISSIQEKEAFIRKNKTQMEEAANKSEAMQALLDYINGEIKYFVLRNNEHRWNEKTYIVHADDIADFLNMSKSAPKEKLVPLLSIKGVCGEVVFYQPEIWLSGKHKDYDLGITYRAFLYKDEESARTMAHKQILCRLDRQWKERHGKSGFSRFYFDVDDAEKLNLSIPGHILEHNLKARLEIASEELNQEKVKSGDCLKKIGELEATIHDFKNQLSIFA